MKTLLVGLTTTIVGVVLGWYLANVYSQPEILWYSRPYYKIDNMAIGNIFLWNSGRKADHDVTITLDANINDSDISIVDLTSSYEVRHNDNKTTIIIEELKPGESADITFKDDPAKDDIWITTFVSEHSNITNIPFATESEWWRLPLWLEITILMLTLIVGGLIGSHFREKPLSDRLIGSRPSPLATVRKIPRTRGKN